MSAERERYQRLGRYVPLRGLLEQGHVAIELARELAAPLADFGFDAARQQALAAAVAEVEARLAARAGRGAQRQGRARAEAEAFSRAMGVVRQLRAVLPIALRARTDLEIEADAFRVGGKFRRSTPTLLEYLSRIGPQVAQLDEPLRSFFRGEKASQVLAKVRGDLAAADSAQESAHAAGPEQTRALWEAKGRLLEAIDDLNRVGRVAFADRAETAARFNRSVLGRARAGRRGSPSPESAGPVRLERSSGRS